MCNLCTMDSNNVFYSEKFYDFKIGNKGEDNSVHVDTRCVCSSDQQLSPIYGNKLGQFSLPFLSSPSSYSDNDLLRGNYCSDENSMDSSLPENYCDFVLDYFNDPTLLSDSFHSAAFSSNHIAGRNTNDLSIIGCDEVNFDAGVPFNVLEMTYEPQGCFALNEPSLDKNQCKQSKGKIQKCTQQNDMVLPEICHAHSPKDSSSVNCASNNKSINHSKRRRQNEDLLISNNDFQLEEEDEATELDADKSRKNARQAKLNREKKKAYIADLENQVKHLTKENGKLNDQVKEAVKEKARCMQEVNYLRSVLLNQSTLSKLLSGLPDIQGVRLRSSLALDRPRAGLDHDYGFDENFLTSGDNSKALYSGGICLHVNKDAASLEFCSFCAKSASQLHE